MIELKGIDVIFNKGTSLEHKALEAVDFRVEQGEFVTVIGGNGAGKSKLMNVLADWLRLLWQRVAWLVSLPTTVTATA